MWVRNGSDEMKLSLTLVTITLDEPESHNKICFQSPHSSCYIIEIYCCVLSNTFNTMDQFRMKDLEETCVDMSIDITN